MQGNHTVLINKWFVGGQATTDTQKSFNCCLRIHEWIHQQKTTLQFVGLAEEVLSLKLHLLVRRQTNSHGLEGHTEVVEMLLKDPRVDPSADNNFALTWARRGGRAAVVKLLESDPRVKGW